MKKSSALSSGKTTDYLLGLSEMKRHPNADLAALRLSDGMIGLLKSGRVDNALLCELVTHPDFVQLMADPEIYVNGTAVKQVQGANAIVDAMSAAIIKQLKKAGFGERLESILYNTKSINKTPPALAFCQYRRYFD